MLAEWGKQRSSGDYCRWGAVGSRTFPLIKKETMTLGIPNLWMSWKIKRITLKGNTCQSGAISDQSIWTKRRLFPSHYHLPCSNMAQGMKIQGGREKEPCRNGHIRISWSVPWASAGERETLNRLNMRWSWHLTDMDLGNPEWWKVWNGCKVMQEMRMQWRVGDDSPWSRMSQITFVSAMVSIFVSPRSFILWNPDSHGYGNPRWGLCEVTEL